MVRSAIRKRFWVGMSAASIVLAACGGQPESQEARDESEAASPSDTEAALPSDTEAASPSDSEVTFTSGARVDSLIREGETHFRALYQLTDGGENAEAYFSWDGAKLIFQSTSRDGGCDQIFVIPTRGGTPTRVSNGLGRCTCAYFLPGDQQVLYSSTFESTPDCPPKPDYSRGYVWPIYPTYEIYVASADGSNPQNLTRTPGYDAEATIGPDGTIVFTSAREGDLDIYTMRPDGSEVKRLTDQPGYDGGAFFSPDGSLICYRASHPAGEAELQDYRALLGDGLIRPGQLDIRVMNRDGSNQRRLTDNGAANFGPFFHPSGQKIIYASNVDDPRGRNFDLYMVSLEGGEIERVTHEDTFDGFPMYSPDGRYLVFASNRGARHEGETNLFLAEWVD